MVLYFLKAVNNHRHSLVTPLNALLIDERLSQWYILVSEWVNIDLPYHMVIKPQSGSGSEEKTLCCAQTGIIMQTEHNIEFQTRQMHYEDEYQHGTAVLLRFI